MVITNPSPNPKPAHTMTECLAQFSFPMKCWMIFPIRAPMKMEKITGRGVIAPTTTAIMDMGMRAYLNTTDKTAVMIKAPSNHVGLKAETVPDAQMDWSSARVGQ